MKNATSKSTVTALQTDVTADNFFEKRKACAYAVGACIELDPAEDKVELNAWLKYFCLKAPAGPTPGEGWGDRWKDMMRQIDRIGVYLVPVRWPWEFDAEVTKEQVENQWLKTLWSWRSEGQSRKRLARPETTASAMAFYRARGVENLDPDHPDRLRATADWGKQYMASLPKAPQVKGFKTL